MKNIPILLAVCSIYSGAIAQQSKPMMNNGRHSEIRTQFNQSPTSHFTNRGPRAKLAAKTTATTFWGPETFGSGTSTSLPTGWSTSSLPSPGGGTWKWANTASTSTYTMGSMSSTSASDGWMIFDSDLIGAISGGSPSGYFQSPAITACATESSVRVNFENYFRNFNDSCSIWVSTNSSFTPGTYSVFPVYFNNSLAVNVSTANPSIVHVNISSAAAMQPTVYIRFVYYGYAGGSYSWMIDDITLSSMDAVDAGVSKSAALYFSGTNTGWAAFGSKPAKMMDTIYPVSMVANYGTTGFPAATVNAKIFQGTTNVYDQNTSVNIPVDALDTIADYTSVGTPPGYYSTVTANYLVPFNINLGSDADATNNNDSASFVITDTSWTENAPGAASVGGQYVYRSTPAMAFSPATGFVVSANRSDTVTSISVAFDDTTAVGQIVGVQLYHFDGADWQYNGSTVFRPLVAEDISSATTIAYANFVVDYVETGGYMILDGGSDGASYAAVVKGYNNTSEVVVLSTVAPGPQSIIGYAGLSDTSNNDGALGQQFGATGLPYANSSVARISLNFGNVPTIGISQVNMNGDKVGKAFPNPANNAVNIPFTLASDGNAVISITGITGQVVTAQHISSKGGVQNYATFATENLPAGIYFYTFNVDGRQTTGKFAITH
jgi:hypothetical protein